MKQRSFARTASALLAGAWMVSATVASAATTAWNGPGDKFWSTAGNWSPSKPTSADDVIFGNADASGTAGPTGTPNSIVNAAFTSSLKSLRFTNTAGFHNVLLTNNLVISGSSAVPLFVGTGEAGTAGQTITATLQGHATLAITNSSSGILRICQGYASAGAHKATLNLTGLDNFAASVSGLYQALNADGNSSSSNSRPCADILLAKTNYIAASTLTISESYNNGGAQSAMRLGQANTFNVGTLRIGSRKGNALFNFNTGLSSPTARFRDQSGSTNGVWDIGEDYGSASGTASTGVMDLSGGTVDALVDTIYVGKGQSSSPGAGDGTGTLTFNLGTIDAKAVEIGYQMLGSGSVGRGTVNVNGSGWLKVGKDLRMGYLLPGNTDTTTGTLVINGGTVTVAGNLVDGGADASTTTLVVTNNGTLDLKPSGDAVAGNITVDALAVGVANITNFDTLTTASITVRAPATAFTLYPGETLVPFGTGLAGTLPVTGDLKLTNATLKLDLGSVSDQVAVSGTLQLDGTNALVITPDGGFGANSYPLFTYGTGLMGDVTQSLALAGAAASSRYSFSFDTNTTAGTVYLVVSGAANSLTWSGDGLGNVWDLNHTANWNAGSEKFFNLDTVTFDDSGSASPAVNLVGALMPAAVNVNGSKAYTFGGSGKLSGFASLNQQSSDTLTILTTNDYTGITSIGGSSTLQLGNGTTADGALGSGEIQNGNALVFAPVGLQTVSSVISGGGSVNKKGPGTTVLAGANTFSGPVTIDGGTLKAGATGALGDAGAGTTINPGGTLDVGGINLGDEAITVAGAGVNGAGAIVNSGASQGNALDNISLVGDTVFGGPNRWDIDGVSSSATKPGLAGNGYKLTKVANNQISLAQYNASAPWNTALGDIEVQAGILSIQCYVSMGDNTKSLIIRSNAAVEFCHNGPTVLDKPTFLTNGCLQARYFSSSYPTYTELSGPITINGTNNVLDVFATTMSLIVDGVISGPGSLIKGIGRHTEGGNTSTGVGTLILNAANTFTGDLTVQTGTLVLSNSASVSTTPNIILAGGTLDASKRTDQTLTLASGQTLKGNGTVIGTVTAPSGTTVAPGVSTNAATLNVTGNVTLRGDTVMDITKTTADKLAATGSLDLGGRLTVTLAGTTALAPGDRFTLFSAPAYQNSFATVILPTLTPGKAWSNSVVGANWNIEVISIEPPTPPVLTNTFSAAGLKLSWDTAYTSYSLVGQTNPPGAGLNTNSSAWAPVPGVVGNQITVPVDPAAGSAFFRLKK
jgi:autotransporter-associated beta strand protein